METVKPKRDRREYYRAWREANPEKARESNRAWRAANLEKAREDNRAWRAANPEYNRAWRAANPERNRAWRAANLEKVREYNRAYARVSSRKIKAKQAIARLITAGRICSPWVCENCHTVEKLDAHHDDYAYPLQIRWLCRSCHQRWHAEHGEAPNGATPPYYAITRKYRLRTPALRAIRRQLQITPIKQRSALCASTTARSAEN